MKSTSPAAARPANPLRPAEPSPGLEALKVAGHDFKTPLTTLKTLAQLLQQSLEKGTLMAQSERTARNCKMLNEQVDRLVDLSDQLLDVARALSGRLKFNPSRTDLRQVIRGAAAATVVVEDVVLPEEEVYVDIDAARLEQAFKTLLSEATRARMSLEKKDNHAVVTFDGEYKPLAARNIPSYFIASTIFEMHGVVVSGRFTVGPFLVSSPKI